MIVKVLYFAAAQELASRKSEDVEVPEGDSVGQLATRILRAHPGLMPISRSVRFSVNLIVASEDTRLRDGDQVGVLPPVAGG